VLLAVAFVGLGLSMASEVWTTVAHRQRLEQLEFAGNQIAQAIGSYYESTPGLAKRYPRTLDELLEDRRFPVTRRHLRQVFRNPLDDQGRWEAIGAPGGGIAGVRATNPAAGGKGVAAAEFRYP
jgi:type II secretory pathway pseudopilin PulG